MLCSNTKSGIFVRGCLHKDQCPDSDGTPHYIRNDYYCGSGIGGDTPNCENTMTPGDPCDSADPIKQVPDGKSGTLFDMAKGLTDKNTGVFRKSFAYILYA